MHFTYMYVTCLSHVMSVSNHVTRVTRVTRLFHVSRPFSFGPASGLSAHLDSPFDKQLTRDT